jgi:hypothetical protein
VERQNQGLVLLVRANIYNFLVSAWPASSFVTSNKISYGNTPKQLMILHGLGLRWYSGLRHSRGIKPMNYHQLENLMWNLLENKAYSSKRKSRKTQMVAQGDQYVETLSRTKMWGPHLRPDFETRPSLPGRDMDVGCHSLPLYLFRHQFFFFELFVYTDNYLSSAVIQHRI